MPIQRRASRSLANIGAQSRANAAPLQQFGIAQAVADKQKMLAAIQFLFDERDRKAREKKAEEKRKKGATTAGIGAGAGAAIGTLIAPGVGTAYGASIGGKIGQSAAEISSPEAGAGAAPVADLASSLAPLAGGVAGGFKGISPHESGTWGEQFRKGFGNTMNDMQKWAALNPMAARSIGMPTDFTPVGNEASGTAIPSARYAPPPAFGNYKMTSPGEAGYTPPVKFGPPPSPGVAVPQRGSQAPPWFENPYAPQWFNAPRY